MAEIPTRVLGDGTSVPVLGFGTYPLRGDDGVRAIASALEVGYRLIDTAVNYRNEREVTEAIRVSGVDRGDVFVQTKVPGRDHENARTSIETSLQVMDLEYLDSVLIHWPNPSQGEYEYAWDGLVAARERGLTRSIGVSNFHPHHLDRIISSVGVTPLVNQVELHPYLQQHGRWDLIGIPLASAVMLLAAGQVGATECLFATSDGDLCEGTGSNVAVVVDDELLDEDVVGDVGPGSGALEHPASTAVTAHVSTTALIPRM